MDAINQALTAVWTALVAIFGLFAVLLAAIEAWLRRFMDQAGVAHQAQTVILVVVAIVFILAVLRTFGGLIRLALVVFLILLLLHIALPGGAGSGGGVPL